MSTIFLTEPPFIVECGPYAGVYFSREAYEEHVRRLNPMEAYKPIEPLKSIFDQDPWLDEGGSG